MGLPSRRIHHFTDIARIFTVLTLLALIYLAVGVTRGLDNPKTRRELAARLVHFEIPEGYRLSSAVYMAVSRFAVLLNDKTGQRIRISEPRLGAENRPGGFLDTYGKVGSTVRRYRNLGGFDEIVIEATGEIVIGGHRCPFVKGVFLPGEEKGELFLLFCPVTGKAYTIVASAPRGRYDPEETREWLATIRCHAGADVTRPGSRSTRSSTRRGTSVDGTCAVAMPLRYATSGFRCSPR